MKPDQYVAAVLRLYTAMPDTPDRVRPNDRVLAWRLQADDIPFFVVKAAICLATVRRLNRPDATHPLPPVRSLHYYLPVVHELRASPGLTPDYATAVELNLRHVIRWLEAREKPPQRTFQPSIESCSPCASAPSVATEEPS